MATGACVQTFLTNVERRPYTHTTTLSRVFKYIGRVSVNLWNVQIPPAYIHTYTWKCIYTSDNPYTHVFNIYKHIYIYKCDTCSCVHTSFESFYTRNMLVYKYIYYIYTRVCTEVSTTTYIYIVYRHVSTIIHMYV